jgi:hypothetical protein
MYKLQSCNNINTNSVCNSLSKPEKISAFKKRRETKQTRQFFLAHGIEFGDVNTKLKYMTLIIFFSPSYRPGVAQRVCRGIALLLHDRGTRRGWVVSVTLRPCFTPRKDPVTIVQEAGWAPEPVWTGAEYLASPGFDPRTVQPVIIRCTDWATRPTIYDP